MIDRLHSTGEHEYRLHWLLPDTSREELNGGMGAQFTGRDGAISTVEVATAGADALASWMRADEQTCRGWVSPRYLERVPAWSWEIRASGTVVYFATHFGRAVTEVVFVAASVQVAGTTLSLGRDSALVRDAQALISTA